MGSKEPTLPLFLKVLAVVVFGIAALMLAIYFLQFSNGLSRDSAVWGQFGDYVGGILNPLLSVPAFFAILYTIKLQADTVRMQSKQINDAAVAFDLQAAHSETTFFDARFFQLVDLHQKVLNAIEVYPKVFSYPGRQDSSSRNPYVGNRAIAYLWNGFLQDDLYEAYNAQEVGEDSYEIVRKQFSVWRAHNWNHVGKYIKNFANILAYVSMSYGRPEKWLFATDIVRANLSQDEQNILFYFLVFSDEFNSYISLFVTGGFLDDKDSQDPFLSERGDFLFRKTHEVLIKKPGETEDSFSNKNEPQ